MIHRWNATPPQICVLGWACLVIFFRDDSLPQAIKAERFVPMRVVMKYRSHWGPPQKGRYLDTKWSETALHLWCMAPCRKDWQSDTREKKNFITLKNCNALKGVICWYCGSYESLLLVPITFMTGKKWIYVTRVNEEFYYDEEELNFGCASSLSLLNFDCYK